MSILLIVTGGTLDKNYQEISGELGFSETHLSDMLAQSRVTQPIELHPLMLKDSLDMNEEDRAQILATCQNAQQQQIVITHGTDTMALTAAYLNQHLNPLDQTIILTGAMRPFKLGHSDSLFNLGAAIMACQLAKPGIYLTMNGQLFEAGKVHKNKSIGIFETLSQNSD